MTPRVRSVRSSVLDERALAARGADVRRLVLRAVRAGPAASYASGNAAPLTAPIGPLRHRVALGRPVRRVVPHMPRLRSTPVCRRLARDRPALVRGSRALGTCKPPTGSVNLAPRWLGGRAVADCGVTTLPLSDSFSTVAGIPQRATARDSAHLASA